MSGIIGIWNLDGRPVEKAMLTRMSATLAHRGPDGEGLWMQGSVGLGHRLLFTTPESLHEKQPVTDGHGECWLVWDGRLDNREELHATLKAEGRSLGGQTDPELVLGAYRQWGVDCLKRIIGEFAFALWDERTQSLLCARDPIGVKPLYYHWDGERLLFGSEVKALFADPKIVKRPDEAIIADYLLRGFRDPEATFFEGIKQLRPAHFLCLGGQGFRIERYWDVDPSRQVRYAREEDYHEQFQELFREAVRCRLRSIAPVGVLLSGGIDSTSVAAMAETLRRGEGATRGLAAFTLLVDGFLQEEWEAIQYLVGTYGAEIHPICPESRNGPVTLFELFLECAETPHYDALPSIPLLFEPASARGCRLLLTGLGADELSGGAEQGFLVALLCAFKLRRLAQEAQRTATTYGEGDWRALILMLCWAQLPPWFRWLIKTVLSRQTPRWFRAEFAGRVKLNQRMMPRENRKFPTSCEAETYRELTKPATAIALNQIDGVASAFSLECRHPYLDRRLIEFFLSIPSSVKMRAGYRKQFVQRAMVGITPGPIRGKEGLDCFVPLMDRQICSKLEVKRMERELLQPEARIFRYVRRSEVERLMEEYRRGHAQYGNLLWNLVKLELWLQQWFPERRSSQGGTS